MPPRDKTSPFDLGTGLDIPFEESVVQNNQTPLAPSERQIEARRTAPRNEDQTRKLRQRLLEGNLVTNPTPSSPLGVDVGDQDPFGLGIGAGSRGTFGRGVISTAVTKKRR